MGRENPYVRRTQQSSQDRLVSHPPCPSESRNGRTSLQKQINDYYDEFRGGSLAHTEKPKQEKGTSLMKKRSGGTGFVGMNGTPTVWKRSYKRKKSSFPLHLGRVQGESTTRTRGIGVRKNQNRLREKGRFNQKLYPRGRSGEDVSRTLQREEKGKEFVNHQWGWG